MQLISKDWKQLVDYYFNATTGLGCFESRRRKSKTRLGEPKAKHQVVIAIPEPIVHKTPSDEKSTTVYWGNLNGQYHRISPSIKIEWMLVSGTLITFVRSGKS